MTEPIIEFESQEQLDASLKEWVERLFLTDWTIKAELCEADEMELSDCAGENSWQYVNRSSVIRLLKKPPDDRIAKVLHEKALVHELLHLKIIYDFVREESPQDCLWCANQHALIEQMAKALIMAKYSLSPSWFKNF